MKFWIVAAALAVFAESASAFVPTNTNANPQKTPLAVLPKSSDWKGYYTDYDDRQIIKTGADVDFDPLGLADTNAALFWMREAEIKHCRLAM